MRLHIGTTGLLLGGIGNHTFLQVAQPNYILWEGEGPNWSWICIADEAISGAGLKVEKCGNITNLKLASPQMKVGQDALWVITDWDEGKTDPTCQISHSCVSKIEKIGRIFKDSCLRHIWVQICARWSCITLNKCVLVWTSNCLSPPYADCWCPILGCAICHKGDWPQKILFCRAIVFWLYFSSSTTPHLQWNYPWRWNWAVFLVRKCPPKLLLRLTLIEHVGRKGTFLWRASLTNCRRSPCPICHLWSHPSLDMARYRAYMCPELRSNWCNS